jgi:hypothetical protein
MQNPWLGISPGIDPVGLARLLAKAHERAAAGRPVPPMVREVISSSWARAVDAGIDPGEHDVPMVLDYGDAMSRWSEHPLSRFGTVIEGVLGEVAHDVQHLVTAADVDGTMLWSMGHPRVLAASESIRFVPGHLWDEDVAGTNGIGTALKVDHAVQIFSAEHYARRYHQWCCTGAPVHDPETGKALGALCLSTGIKGAHPYALSLVQSAASTIEAMLGGELAMRREALKSRYFELAASRPGTPSALVDRAGHVLACQPVGWLHGPLVRVDGGGWIGSGDQTVLAAEPLAHGASVVWRERASTQHPAPPEEPLEIEVLGRSSARIRLHGHEIVLPPRRSEVLLLLALSPGGLTARDLAIELYGSDDALVTVRAEVSRLRRQLGGLLGTKPYRLVGPVRVDLLELEARLEEHGPDGDGARDSGAEPLPGADSPTVLAARDRLHALRHPDAPPPAVPMAEAA